MSTELSKSGDAGEDGRAHPRLPVYEKASICLLGIGWTAECEVLDLSVGGCRLLLLEPLAISAGVQVEGTFRIRGTSLRICGIVRWTDGKRSLGVLFSDMSVRCKGMLQELIAELKARRNAMIGAAVELELRGPESK